MTPSPPSPPVTPDPDVPVPDVPVPDVPVPDDKDWTWVLDRGCPECGFVAGALSRPELLAAVGALASSWTALLASGDAHLRERPALAVWSPSEYGCHVRDVLRTFEGRFGALLGEDDPVFANWDQDATALAERYWEQDPAVVATELDAAAQVLTGVLDAGALDDAAWARPGRRSNGSVFTVETLLRYMLHDLAHHLHDVGVARPV